MALIWQRSITRLLLLATMFLLAACGGSQQTPSAPAPPTDVQAEPEAGSVVVTWRDNSNNESGFRIRRTVNETGQTEDADYEVVGTVGANETRFVDNEVIAGALYVYEVAAFNASGESAHASQEGPPIGPTPTKRSLTVSVSGEGNVKSAPTGIECGSDCYEIFPEGTVVIVMAAPNQGSAFSGWTGACSGTSLTCSLVIDEDKAVSANFVALPPAPPGEHVLSVSLAGGGTGSVISDPPGIDCGATCVKSFSTGTRVQLIAEPGPSSTFAGWQGECSDTDLVCDVAIDQSRSVIATFSATSQLAVKKSGAGKGAVTSTPAGINCGSKCEATFEEGTLVVLTAEPADGSTFTGWSGGGCSGTGSCQVVAGADTTVTASFGLQTFELVVQAEGPGQVSSTPVGIECGQDCSHDFPAGTLVALSAKPQQGAEFLGWEGACAGTDLVCNVTLNDDKEVVAKFGETAIVVTSTAATKDGSECTLRAAIEAANLDRPVGGCRAGSGADVIRLPHNVTVALLGIDNEISGPNGLPSVSSRITIEGNGSTVERGDVETAFRIFHVSEGGQLTLENLTVRNGDSSTFPGGGIHVRGGELHLYMSTVEENNAARDPDAIGAGLYVADGSAFVLSSSIVRNRNAMGDYYESTNGAGIAVVDSDLTIDNSSIEANVSGHVGGILILGANSTVKITKSTIQRNNGLGVSNEGNLWLTDVTVRRNANAAGTGGFYNSGNAYLSNVLYEDHESEHGGAISNSGYLSLSDSIVRRNSAGENGSGGGINNGGTMEISNTLIAENDDGEGVAPGGGITNSGTLLIFDSEILANRSVEGAGIWNYGDVTIRDTKIDGNTALRGAGIFNLGKVTLEGTTTIGGAAGNRASSGAGVYMGDEWHTSSVPELELTGSSSIAGNRATEDGGGVYAWGPAEIRICETCSIRVNSADSDGDGSGNGGGVYGSDVFMTWSTQNRIFSNTPDDIAP